MVSAVLSRLMGLVRVKYIALVFGRGMEADAFNAAFVLPDMLSYFLVGGAASITFVTILTRYRDAGREAELARELIDLHYDPAYSRSSHQNFSELPHATHMLFRPNDADVVEQARALLARLDAVPVTSASSA